MHARVLVRCCRQYDRSINNSLDCCAKSGTLSSHYYKRFWKRESSFRNLIPRRDQGPMGADESPEFCLRYLYGEVETVAMTEMTSPVNMTSKSRITYILRAGVSAPRVCKW